MPTLTHSPICNYQKDVEDVPELKVQYFYSSPVAIDDPAFVLPAPGKYTPLPFPEQDNDALEKVWQKCFAEATWKPQTVNHGKDARPSSSRSHDNQMWSKNKLEGNSLPTLKVTCEPGVQEKDQCKIKDDWDITIENDPDSGKGASTPSSESSYMSCEEGPCSTPGKAELERILQVAAESNSGWEEVGLNKSSATVPEAPKSRRPSFDPQTLNALQYQGHSHKEPAHQDKTIDVPVGVSKLYGIRIPALQIFPIYWAPIRDGPTISRGTWFYKDTMYPVEPALANQLELGYVKTRPWNQDWIDRLSKAIEEGANEDQSFLHKLRLENDDEAVPESDSTSGSSPHRHNAKCLCANCSADSQNPVPTTRDDVKLNEQPAIIKSYLGSLVCYQDSTNAFILRPGIEQFRYYRLRPLSKMIGGNVGIPIVRGFNREAWERLHPSPKASPPSPTSSSTTLPTTTPPTRIPTPPQTTDLILVVHGIGQKLSERYQDYSFTYAVNSLRLGINTDLQNPLVRSSLRPNFGGITILPINWRLCFKFGDVPPNPNPILNSNSNDHPPNQHFGLSDITPHSIPAVRSLISDVLLDIPLYMSAHKTQMAEAVVKEANRIYRLWCHHNPGFEKWGRVHIIGHSLGSALCLDILSKQPTFIKPSDTKDKISTEHFEFNTANLFFVGSPVGFFLLLNGKKLIPRQGRTKSDLGLDEENTRDITGKEGTYGCMAVDNLYNVLHYDDPIAYRVNATIDVDFADGIKKMEVPSAVKGPGWLDTFSSAISQSMPNFSSTSLPSTPPNLNPTKQKPNLSPVEKTFFLLNDNGQLDYFLKASEGPDIQYLNMLWAHGSYWSNADFARMLVTECGREKGVRNAVGSMRTRREDE